MPTLQVKLKWTENDKIIYLSKLQRKLLHISTAYLFKLLGLNGLNHYCLYIYIVYDLFSFAFYQKSTNVADVQYAILL